MYLSAGSFGANSVIVFLRYSHSRLTEVTPLNYNKSCVINLAKTTNMSIENHLVLQGGRSFDLSAPYDQSNQFGERITITLID